MMRVMFVDDEKQVLKGIKRMLDLADVDWEIEVANSGAEALESMERELVDVLVVDMKMPEMDGGQLLDIVSEKYPDVVRIVLSGQANKDSVYRAVTPMHQYLAKPCEADKLRSTVARACALREMFESTRTHAMLGKISSLPSLPSLYQEVVNEMESENSTVARVGEIVEQDPAMSAKLLQLANSAIFGLPSSVTSPAQAAAMIGLDTLKALVLSIQVFKSFEGVSVPGFSIDRVNRHSLQVATISRQIAKAEKLDKHTTNEAFTGGLLHDIGKLILAANMPEEFGNALKLSREKNIALVEAEANVFGLGHDAIASYLLTLWGLPQSIVEAVAFHHRPTECLGKELAAPAIIYAANYLAHESENRVSEEQKQACEDLFCQLQLSERLNQWRQTALETGE